MDECQAFPSHCRMKKIRESPLDKSGFHVYYNHHKDLTNLFLGESMEQTHGAVKGSTGF